LKFIYDTYYNDLCINAYRLLKDESTSEDIVQEVIIEYWNKDNKADVNDLKAYLYKSVYFRSINYIKKNKRIGTGEITEFRDHGKGTTIEDDIDYQETLATINGVIDELPERSRLAFVLSRFENKTYKEISNDLSISVKTVENQIGYALKYLRSKIKNREE
jgi:RNA polymerase sigma-70 factor (ECF subfamily)